MTSWNLSGQKQAPDPLETPIASKARVYFRLISHLHALEHFHQGNAFKFTSIIAINLKCLIKNNMLEQSNRNMQLRRKHLWQLLPAMRLLRGRHSEWP